MSFGLKAVSSLSRRSLILAAGSTAALAAAGLGMPLRAQDAPVPAAPQQFSFDLLTELDVVNKGNTGFRISAASWYDYAYRDVGADENPFINGNSASASAWRARSP